MKDELIITHQQAKAAAEQCRYRNTYTKIQNTNLVELCLVVSNSLTRYWSAHHIFVSSFCLRVMKRFWQCVPPFRALISQALLEFFRIGALEF